ncbi:glycosyltransferase [Beijerinckia mobilis]|uniref:glycosyltransferase n=1 Tax=Beijerinckia mobilis TaxID=231434 RepID=UPI00069243FF|nr:glycosyltransferase [Beijerinckia mobilis]
MKPLPSIDFLRVGLESSLLLSILGLLLVASGFLALIGINIFELLIGRRLRTPAPGPILAEAALPHVLIQIPIFNEPEMVAGALEAAAALQWPRDRLHIQLLDDSTDDTSHAAQKVVQDLRAQGVDVLHLRRADRSGYKAGALAAGMMRNDAPYIAVFDVDFRPPPNWLRVVVPMMIADPKAAFVQSRCEFSNYRTNWLTRIQGMMMDAHYTMEQATRYRAGWLFQFNGTAGLWRREAIVAAGGWSGDSLCEDLDLTVRAEVAGWHGVFTMEPVVPGLVPEKVQHWRVQQRRWSTGFVQVTRKLMKQIWASDLSFRLKASASLLILIQAFYPCAAIATASVLGGIALDGGDATEFMPVLNGFAAVVAFVAISLTLVPYLVLRRGPLYQYLLTVILLPPMMIYISLSNAPAILKSTFGGTETWKRTPKSSTLATTAPTSEA